MIRICLILAASAVALAVPTTALADGGYLHLREANALARAVQVKKGGHTSLAPCVRVDAHRADCALTARSANVYCQWTIHVVKRFANRRFFWKATTSAGDCEYGQAPASSQP